MGSTVQHFARYVTLACIVILACVSPRMIEAQSSSRAHEEAESTTDDDPRAYNGSFVEPSLRGAWVRADSRNLEGWGLDVGLRSASLLSLVDVRLAYRLDALRSTSANASSRTFSHTLGGHLALHPLALFVFGSDWLPYTIASLYVEIGGGARGAPSGSGRTAAFGVAPVWSVGAGLDVPLGDADRGWLPWLHLLYRYNRGRWPAAQPQRALELHGVFVGLGLRTHGSLF